MFHLLLLPFVISPLSVEHTSTGVSAMKIENRRVLEVDWKDSKMLGKKPLPPKNKEPYWNPPPNVSPYKGKKVVALTFDDGPNGKTTERLLDILKKE
jgi:peptidoglycan/xylan/chitin deacetylase (PgdA/CDA1 family)